MRITKGKSSGKTVRFVPFSACSLMDKASDCGSDDCEFKSRQAHNGRVQERFIWPVSKTERVARLTEVRILSLPLFVLVVQLDRTSGSELEDLRVRFPPRTPLMKFQFSAGGIVYKNQKSKIKNQKDEILILVAQHSQHHGWVFPKGLIGDKVKETKEETALREVKEETGVSAKIIKPLTPVEYWFKFEGETIRKKVYYFLMEYVSGDTSKHDIEMEKVEWLTIDEIEERLTYPSDKKVWKEAKGGIA